MKLRGILNGALGRLFLPFRTGSSADKGDVWMDGAFVRANTNELTKRELYLLTSIMLGQPNGVPQLNDAGVLPPSYLGQTIGRNIGEVYDWAGDPLKIPTDSLLCDGHEYLRSEFPTLFAVLGVRFGRPSDDLHFKVPDLTDRVTYGAVGGGLAQTGGVSKVNIMTRGSGFAPASYACTFAGGTFSVAATGKVVIGSDGTVQAVEILTPGVYTAIGDPAAGSPSTSGITIVCGALAGGTGFTYEIQMRPTSTRWCARMTARGSAYTYASVTIGGGLLGATGIAIVAPDGGVQEVVITNPGVGDYSTATVTINGDGTGATATLALLHAPVIVGDDVGEAQHLQIKGEVGDHTHLTATNDLSGAGQGVIAPNTGTYQAPWTVYPGTQPMPIRSPGVGLIKLIYAGAA